MPDISMCTNKDCPLKETCYRFKAIPDKYRQSYGGFAPDDKGECKYYWPLKKDSHAGDKN
jgi:hypothetical protein